MNLARPARGDGSEARPGSGDGSEQRPARGDGVEARPGSGDHPARSSRAAEARRVLVGRIMDGTLSPGSPLRIGALSTDLGMSATPVREALTLMAGEKLVEYLPMRGFTVTPPPGDAEVRAMGEARRLLEPEIAALAAERATPEERAALSATLSATARAGVGARFREYEEYLHHSHAFHRQISRAAGNPYLVAALDAIPVHTLRFRRFGDAGVDDAEVSVAEHRRILDALVRGDADLARSAMAAHISGVTDRTLR